MEPNWEEYERRKKEIVPIPDTGGHSYNDLVKQRERKLEDHRFFTEDLINKPKENGGRETIESGGQ